MNQYIKINGEWKHETNRLDPETGEMYYHYLVIKKEDIPPGAKIVDYDAIREWEARRDEVDVPTKAEFQRVVKTHT